MQVKCEYCGNFIEETEKNCPNCGAVNTHMARAAHGVPHTIDALQAFCAAHGVDLEKMHFHIGEDYKEPKAFGIYRDNGEFVVYKNKADGSRAVRYRGTDESYAVNEIYQKLKAELQEVREQSAPAQGEYKYSPPTRSFNPRKPRRRIGCLTWILIIFVGGSLLLGGISLLLQKLGLYTPSPANGYYTYEGQEYRYCDERWYAYDADDGWYYTTVDPFFEENYNDYWDSYSDPYGTYDTYDTYSGNYYDYDDYDYSDNNNWDDDWDDDDWDNDYDYDSWDYGNDWDSDW